MSKYHGNGMGDFSDEVFSRIVSTDQFISDCVIPPDQALESAIQASASANLENIAVAPNQGKLFHILAKLASAKNILEVGTLGGYSAIWLAKALPPNGKLITLELEPKHAQVAEANIKNAGFENVVEVRVGPALETLQKMDAEAWGVGKKNGPFDMVFVDADKPNNWEYVDRALKFSRVGTVIVVDNVGRRGMLADGSVMEGQRGRDVVGTRRMFEMMGKDKRIDVTAVQTVGVKGWDGFAVALVVEL
ncbi:O-methyltransferase-domain-containing protein [Hypoxylon crocopeplum]|nr:O-methyltransferase-domain-containing protein [Hypoxylon crocopeplum]